MSFNDKNFLTDNIVDFIDEKINDLTSEIDIDYASLLPKKSEDFVQQVLKDPKGELVVNEPIHDVMHRFIRKAKKFGFNKYGVIGGFGMGKSMISGSYVIMYDYSLKKVEDVVVGDLLMGPDSKPRKVLALGRGKEQAYKVTLKNRDSFKCNASHIIPFMISNRWKGLKKGDTLCMTIQDYIDCPETSKKNRVKIQKATLDFEEQSVPIDPYVMGVWLGDGHKNSLTITINNDDKVISDYFTKWGRKYKYKLSMYNKKSGCTQYALVRKDSKFANQFYKEYHKPMLQLVNGEKRIDKRYLKNSRKVRLELLAGMIDTDGYLTSNCYEWSTKYIGLRDDFLLLCRSLGFSVTHRIKTVNFVDYYVVLVSGDTHLVPCKTRKKAQPRKQIKNPLVYGFDIEDIGEQEYFGFTLDGDHLYLQDDFTIHHNTEQLCIGYVLDAIARNPNILVKIVHVSDDQAVSRCRSIRDYIGNDEDFKRIAPHIRPTNIWGSQRFTVKRKTMSKDGTVEAYGVLSTSIGGRANLIVFDDPQDLKTAVFEPTTRAKIEETIKNVWLTRLIPQDSEVLLMMNKWSQFDIAAYVQKNPTWAWMTLAVNEKLDCMLYEDSFGQKYRFPLWTKFNSKDLLDKKETLGERDFNRGYRLIPFSDDDKTFMFYETCCHFGVSPHSIVNNYKEWDFISGIDFSGSKRPGTIIVTVAKHKQTNIKIPVDIVKMKGSTDLIKNMIRLYREYGVDNFIAENNGVQSAIIDMLIASFGDEKYKKYGITIEGFCTGNNKADPNMGLPSLDREFERKEWMFCYNHKPEITDNIDEKIWSRHYYEMKEHPIYETSDIVMATWFCREGFKNMIRRSGNIPIY